MTLPIPQSTTPLLLPTGTSTSQGTTAADAEVASAFRDALAVALGDTAPTRTRRRAGDQQGTETITTLDAANDVVDEATAATGQPVATPRDVRAPSIPTTNGEVLRREGDEAASAENGLVAGRRAHRTEGTTAPETAAEEWTPAIVITPVAIPVLTPMPVEAATSTSRMDSRDILVPEFRGRLERVIERMEQEFGYTVEVIETGRTQERQDALFAQGRTAPGPIVTWTRASRHTHGLAADVTIDGGWSDRTAFARLAAIAEEEGLRTLGPRDPGHIELPGANVSRPVAERLTRPVFPGTPRPVADPADRLFERPTSMPDRVSIMPVDGEGVSILPVDRGNVTIMPVDDGLVSVMPVEPGRVSVMPVEPGRVSVMPVESERVSTMPVRPPRVGGDELLHVLPAVPSRDHPRGDHAEEPTLHVLPVTNPDRGVEAAPVPLEELFEEFPMALGTPRPAMKAAPPAPTGIATVAKVAPVADVARVATVAAPALVRNEAPRVTRDASPRLREGQESLAIPERAVDAPVPAVVRDIIAGAERSAGIRSWGLSAEREGARPSEEDPSRDRSRDEGLADLLATPQLDNEAFGARMPERDATLRRDGVTAASTIERTDAAERIARALRLQDAVGDRPVSSVTLRLDHPEGGEDRIRVDLRGRSVGATLDVADASAADHLRAHARELHQALERAGLEGERVIVRATREASQAIASAAGAERESVRAASSSSSSNWNGATSRDPRAPRDPNHSQQRHDQPASRQRRDQGGQR